jgi:hypothetical protein
MGADVGDIKVMDDGAEFGGRMTCSDPDDDTE